jgi:hypothetical protein
VKVSTELEKQSLTYDYCKPSKSIEISQEEKEFKVIKKKTISKINYYMMKIKSLMYPEGSKKRRSTKLLEIAEIERKLYLLNEECDDIDKEPSQKKMTKAIMDEKGIMLMWKDLNHTFQMSSSIVQMLGIKIFQVVVDFLL